MSSFLKAFADGYDDLGLGDGAPVYPGPGPDKPPGEYTLIRQTGGLEYIWPTNKVAYITLKVQVLGPARQAYGALHERATAAHDALHEKRAWTLAGYSACLIRALQPPFDEGIINGLQSVSFNLLVTARTLRPEPEPEEE
jgi:hypothetical protein